MKLKMREKNGHIVVSDSVSITLVTRVQSVHQFVVASSIIVSNISSSAIILDGVRLVVGRLRVWAPAAPNQRR